MARYHWVLKTSVKARVTEDDVLQAFRLIRDETAKVFRAYGAGILLGKKKISSAVS
ncbi:MAG TPA: hypothetical protein VIH58_10575 [Chthoniobacterales bacterium]